MNSPRELYKAHRSGRAHVGPAAGMGSKTLHRHDFVRPTQPNPHMMECNDYLLWTLVQQKDPLLKHGRKAIERLLTETMGYNVLPGEHKSFDPNKTSTSHAFEQSGKTHGIHAKESSYPAWPASAPAYYASSAPSEVRSSRAPSEIGGSAQRPRTAPSAQRPRTQGDNRGPQRGSNERSRAQSARAGGRQDARRPPQARQEQRRDRPERQDRPVRAKSASANHRCTQTSFSERRASARS